MYFHIESFAFWLSSHFITMVCKGCNTVPNGLILWSISGSMSSHALTYFPPQLLGGFHCASSVCPESGSHQVVGTRELTQEGKIFGKIKVYWWCRSI